MLIRPKIQQDFKAKSKIPLFLQAEKSKHSSIGVGVVEFFIKNQTKLKQRRALALYSGGLDSLLAMKLIKDQGIEVIALNFVSHFFGGENDRSKKLCEQIGVKLEYVDFKKEHTEVVKNPANGRGKNMNPCVDCHALMMSFTSEHLMKKYDADFLISGEVLNQRPMSQTRGPLEKVQKLSGMEDLIVRPMSAKLLPPTKPVREGWVDIEKLENISGRGRHRQMEMAAEFGITDYPKPAGGCWLTEPAYSDRLRVLEEDGLLEHEHAPLFKLIRNSRFLRLGEQKYLFMARNQEEEAIVERYANLSSFMVEGTDKTPGPAILGYGEMTPEDMELVKDLFSRYSRAKGKVDAHLKINQEDVVHAPFEVETLQDRVKDLMIG
ncbi:tRNA (5-methylaminomethyl-2-thiouridylate)-methyltransferase [Persicobacter sp. CCB-QB2]|uniref:tRNA 2-thiouridine(34) synthase MnmA n=1 Tax=Persicobacter diffluens TaxID=981 RepID=A0AAN4VWC0_9BACT|nr:tRNA (5-methylaminomethyl-2-thiouridylate)-methyltransferase [Persicobacter sp. CCB-QB2]GJM60908.1 tRNA 2-thiouridine(34) synthase MnmA [Persicobacter diffluens]